ncbi:MAG: aminotransferase class V-fold PLP-dependent enzyme [Holosporaceae bacterium]|jgi:phosphoserine aminotransferase|nr:aminotransferase class V-fold PLP-dependent enzyme [Holosporaceae bacterium]
MYKLLCMSFSAGPCSKYSGWQSPAGMLAGRSHRSDEGVLLIQEVIRLQRRILAIPDDYFLGLVSASASGAVETLLWSLLGANGVDILSQCVFSRHWEHDIVYELQLKDVRVFRADFPQMADVKDVNFNRDVVFCWTSTTSGTSFRDANWIASNRGGLTICDATSAVFMFDFDWSKLDATAFSWQKGLGGEAGVGAIVLGPRAIARLESHRPPWPVPRIFRIAQNKVVNFGVFNGYIVNTLSMLAIEDFKNILLWAQQMGGIPALQQKIEDNYNVAKQWIARSSIFKFFADEKCRAHHIACLDIDSEKYQHLSEEDKWKFLTKIVQRSIQKQLGSDFLGHSQTKPHLRIWMGPTIEAKKLSALFAGIEGICLELLNELPR